MPTKRADGVPEGFEFLRRGMAAQKAVNQAVADASSGKRFRLGQHYRIHIYEGEIPVATAMTVEYARQIVNALNASNGLSNLYLTILTDKLEEVTRTTGHNFADLIAMVRLHMSEREENA